jgi:CBS domain-containing protein
VEDLTVLQAKRYGVIHCDAQTTLREAARRMADEDISALIVTDDDGSLAGVITRTDLVRAHRERPDWAAQPVAHYMSRDVVTVTPEARLNHVAELLLDKHIHRVVVVEDDGSKRRPLSVVSSADLVYHMSKEA